MDWGIFPSHHCVLEFPGAFAGHHVAVGGDCADLDGAGDAWEIWRLEVGEASWVWFGLELTWPFRRTSKVICLPLLEGCLLVP